MKSEICFSVDSLHKVFMLHHGIADENLRTTNLDVSALCHVRIWILV